MVQETGRMEACPNGWDVRGKLSYLEVGCKEGPKLKDKNGFEDGGDGCR